jgi:hypothetical protein
LPHATGRRAARLATTVKDGEQHQRLYETVRQRRQELRAWQREGERLLDDLDRLIGRPLQASAPPKKSTPAVPPAAAKSPVSPGRDHQRTFHAQATADIARLRQLFKQARDADDLNEARRISKEVSRIATDRLSGEPRQNLLLLRTDLQTWINSREAAAAHTALRTLFADLATADPEPTPLALRSALAHSKILKRRCPGPLPRDLDTALARLEAQVNGESVTPDDGTPLSATHPSPSGAPPSESAAFTEARAEFAWLVKEIRTAQEAGDLAAVQTARHLAGPIYGRRLSPEDRTAYTPLMREVKAWCQEQDPNTDPKLRRIRQVLAETRPCRQQHGHRATRRIPRRDQFAAPSVGPAPTGARRGSGQAVEAPAQGPHLEQVASRSTARGGPGQGRPRSQGHRTVSPGPSADRDHRQAGRHRPERPQGRGAQRRLTSDVG